ncbi:juvenile hormone esterase-like [Tribolium castaneum]|uniref:Carboxylic ester hydrolase n=1 Tax=Tribolium castaneum TaxID=7070 RepID=D2A327_TRICA|nr:PREDICTED: acetylcholinesterase [Tribolium castaneum]XP_015835092.1 PREDICTED: acetylcholinesterase [Tribolium castaneum]EFA02259.2 Esterase-6-like Protein [Tribolium castaneum]|eukprot:XP_008191747.1 PREDICTED: acetylcholinesterase [Tribolium castaneum]
MKIHQCTVSTFLPSILVLFFVNFGFTQDAPIIKLPNGLIKGRVGQTIAKRPYWAYQKIPFATPPLGDLRFAAPVPSKNWDGVLETTKYDVICYQITSDSDLESEDCLYLNVYTPTDPSNKTNRGLPVMFFIYGGGFIEGNCFDYVYGPEYLLDRGVIVVCANYRVGPFGFLSTGDMTVPGNNGLKDQLLALQWTHDNIHLFGGDPTKVTIFGQSAGSASVAYHLLHTQSQGLFRAVICESGSFLSPWAYQRNARNYAFTTAGLIDEVVGKSNDSQTLLDFLRSVSAKELDQASYKLSLTEAHKNRQILQGFFFAPVIEPKHDGAFISQKMYVQLKKGDFIRVPTLMGFNSEENIFHTYLKLWFESALNTYDKNIDWLVPNDMRINDSEKRKQVGIKIRDIYTNGSDLLENGPSSVRYYSDTSYTRPIRKHAEIQSQFSDVFFYQFSYDGKLGNWSFTVKGAENVSHGEDNCYIWRKYDDYYDNSDLCRFPLPDRITQYRIQTIWTNFAKYLNPTPKKSKLLQNITWPKFDSKAQYVDILKNLEIKSEPKKETYDQWIELYDSLGYDDFDTY